MIRLTPSMLESVRLYLTEDWLDEARLVSSLTEREPPNLVMRAGSEFGDLVNSAPTQTKLDGPQLLDEESAFAADREIDELRDSLELENSWLAEVAARRTFRPNSVGVDEPVILSGRCDDLCGSTVAEYKLTGRVDLMRYMDSIQWRCYAWLFDASRVVYILSQRYGKVPPFKVSKPVTLPLSTYPEVGSDVEDLARRALEIADALGCLDKLRRDA